MTFDDTEVSSEETSETLITEESGSQPESTSAEQQEAAPEVTPEEKPTPFHEHPRWIELQEERRSLKEAYEKQREDFTRLQTQLEMMREASKPKAEQPQDPFLADLEKVNPAYAQSLKGIYERAQKADALEARLNQFEQAQFQEKAVSHFNKILDDKKVTDPFERKIIESSVRDEVQMLERAGKKLNLKDLEKITNDFHAKYTAALEARERAITAKYVQSKSKDMTPKGATGGAAKAPTVKKLAGNDLQGQAKWIAEQIKAMKKEH